MTLTPILELPFQIQMHAAAAMIALVLGPVALWRKRRDTIHKTTGYIWVVAMAIVAISSFFIPSHFTPIGLGPIHGLAVYAAWGLFDAMRAIYRRDIAQHRDIMQNLYMRGILIAGAFNFLPGRSFQRAFIQDAPELGFALIGVVVVIAFWTPLSNCIAKVRTVIAA